MIRMLHIVGSMSPSGIGNFIMNIYRHIDREQVQFDFIVHEHRDVSFDEEIQSLGGKLYYVTRKSVSPIKNFREIRKVVKEGHYQIVFRHTDTSTVALDLLACKLGGAKRRIAHSHSTSTGNKKMHKLFQPMLNMLVTERFACSHDAAKWLYGEKKYNKKQYEVIWNGIHIPQFVFSMEKRRRIREELCVGETYVFGHVGNFLPVKNHLFMVDLFAEIHKKNPNTKLLFVGDGALRTQIEARIIQQGISEAVILAGVRNDTDVLLQGMDVFFFPSNYEGMPIALVEAQAAGLPCLVTEVITDDVIVTDHVMKMNLSQPIEEWADAALRLAKEGFAEGNRRDTSQEIARGGFDVRDLAKRYERI